MYIHFIKDIIFNNKRPTGRSFVNHRDRFIATGSDWIFYLTHRFFFPILLGIFSAKSADEASLDHFFVSNLKNGRKQNAIKNFIFHFHPFYHGVFDAFLKRKIFVR